MDSKFCVNDHREKITTYFETCGVFVCEACVLNEHYNHMNKVFLETVFMDRLKEFKNFKKHLELDLRVKKRHIQSASIDEFFHGIDEFYDKFIQQI